MLVRWEKEKTDFLSLFKTKHKPAPGPGAPQKGILILNDDDHSNRIVNTEGAHTLYVLSTLLDASSHLTEL